jgi:D-alanyl-D-alanine carboxypeptidase
MIFMSVSLVLGRVMALSLTLLFVSVATLQATPSLVMDVDSGRILHAEQASDPWFPASVTKLMTAYVALKEVKEGRITLDTPLIVSRRASSAPPSKMGLRAGAQVTLDNALKMIMVKSANDMALTISEGVGGSMESFAAMMNKEAARLGMRESHFVNPHGLPNPQQTSSARDLAVLGRALLFDFPEHQGLWGIGAIQHGSRVMPNTNGLIGRYYGAEGMKTGFICSSGFNVVATASRGGRRLLVVVLGAPSAGERTLKAGELLDKGFAGGGYVSASPHELPQGYGSAPDMRKEICGGKRRGMPLEDESDLVLPGTFGVGGNTENAALEMLIPQAGGAAVSGGARRARLAQRNIGTPVVVYTGSAPNVDIAARGPGKLTNVAVRPEKENAKSRVVAKSKSKIRDVPQLAAAPSIIQPERSPSASVASLGAIPQKATTPTLNKPKVSKPRPLQEGKVGKEASSSSSSRIVVDDIEEPVKLRPSSQAAIGGNVRPLPRPSSTSGLRTPVSAANPSPRPKAEVADNKVIKKVTSPNNNKRRAAKAQDAEVDDE